MTSGDISYRELAGQELDMQAIFKEQVEGKDFFLVTLLGEFEKQPALKSMLYNHYPVYEETGDYIIFDLRYPTKELE